MNKTGNIVLVGFMGTGKTAVAREISKSLGIPCIDTDHLIVQRVKMSIPEIFEQKGEAHFRSLESDILEELLADEKTNAVISLGGGTPLKESNRPLIKKLGYVAWLRTSVEETYKRVANNKDRPLLQCANPKEKIRDVMIERDPVYAEVSQCKVNTADLNLSELSNGIIDSASYYFSQQQAG